VLRALFTEPERLRPGSTPAQVTEQAAGEFARLADSPRRRGVEAEPATHFLTRLLFCLFAEDVGLLPSRPLTRLAANWQSLPSQFAQSLRDLYRIMATGGAFGPDAIPFFDGGLFADDTAPELTVKRSGASWLDCSIVASGPLLHCIGTVQHHATSGFSSRGRGRRGSGGAGRYGGGHSFRRRHQRCGLRRRGRRHGA
jgi:hypothetical protein